MDATYRPHTFSDDFYAYEENKRIPELFRNMLEQVLVNRPENPLEFLYDLLLKQGVFDVPKVYVLGPPTFDRKLVCATLANKLKLVHLTRPNLEKSFKDEQSLDNECKDLPDSIVKRVNMPDCVQKGWLLEALPKTRQEAFALCKAGVFPSHIVVIEDIILIKKLKHNNPILRDIWTKEELKEMNESLGRLNMILDLYSKSYIRRFQIGKQGTDLDESLSKVVEFVRSKPAAFKSYIPRVLLFGPYGSGRKTMSRMLAETFSLVEINYHEELRKAVLKDSPLKEKFIEIMKTAEPVPDEILAEVAANRLKEEDCKRRGWVMINFPDTRNQVQLLAQRLEGFQINRAVFLDASLEACLERVEPRRWDPVTGENYHLRDLPPPYGKVTDRLVQYPQDSVQSVTADHLLYSRNVVGVKDFLRHGLIKDVVTEVDADAELRVVYEEVQGALLMSTKVKIP